MAEMFSHVLHKRNDEDRGTIHMDANIFRKRKAFMPTYPQRLPMHPRAYANEATLHTLMNLYVQNFVGDFFASIGATQLHNQHTHI